MQAIRTRYHGASNSKGSRISAKCEAGTIYVGFDHDLDTQGNHKAACEALCTKMAWVAPDYVPMVGGMFAGDYYWVFAKDSPYTWDVAP